jgi:HPt (histidine-containing phosphotransfer) domain-containing protein
MNPEIPLSAKTKYIDRRLKEIVQCREALESNDLSISERIGHQMKGNASTFGFRSLEGIARDLETASLEKNISEVKARLTEIERQLLDFQKDL